MEMPPQGLFTKSIDSVNILRGLLAIIVVFSHVSSPALISPAIAGMLLTSNGHIAVWGFFFLSGFVLAKSFLSGKYPLSVGGITKFYARRVLRIIPLYFFIVFICYFSTPDTYVGKQVDLIKLLTFNGSFSVKLTYSGHLWFVSTLIRLYLLAPIGFLLIHFTKKLPAYGKTVLLLLTLFIGMLVRRDLMTTHSFIDSYTFVLANIDIFISGMIFCSMAKSFSLKPLSKAWIIADAFLATLLLFGSYIIYSAQLTVLYFMVFPALTVISLLFLLLVQYPAKNFLRYPLTILGILGVFAYEIYLFHYIFIYYFSLHCTRTCTPTDFFVKSIITILLSLGLAVEIAILKKIWFRVAYGRRTDY